MRYNGVLTIIRASKAPDEGHKAPEAAFWNKFSSA
jgi:hypothetical protein